MTTEMPVAPPRKVKWPRSSIVASPWVFALLVAAVGFLQCYTLVHFTGQKVDESEVVAFAVGFLGGDLNPHWFGYGSFPLYLLSIVYFIVWLMGHAFGVFGSLAEYARMLITDEHFFYGMARYLFACIGVATVLFYARAMRRVGIPVVFSVAYVALAVSHPTAVGYANFVKVDQFVGLFFAVATYSMVVSPHARWTLYIVTVATALAVASKISAAPLVALLAIAASLNYSRERRWRPLALAAAGLLLLILIVQPYSNPISVAVGALKSHAGEQLLSVVRPHYDNVWDRLAAISTYLFAYFSKLHISVLGLVPFVLTKGARKISAALAFVLLLVIAPFIIASDIQPYWMIPAYPLLCAFPVLGAFGLYSLVRRRSAQAGRIVLGILLLVGLLVVAVNCRPIISHWMDPDGASNQKILETWLEKSVLGTDIVVLERSHSNLMPQVMDLSSLAASRDASRLFIFNKRENEFLGELFDDYLVNDYPRKVAAMPRLLPRPVSSMSFKLSLFATGTQRVGLSLICRGANRCPKLHMEVVRGGAVVKNSEGYILTPSRHGQELIFATKEPILLDGTHFLDVSVKGNSDRSGSVSLGPEGQFVAGERLHLPSSGHLRVPLFQFGETPWLVNLRKPADLAKIPRTPGRRLLFVTSPAIYDRYMVLDRTRFKGGDLANVIARQDFYRALLSGSMPLKRISEGSGPAMEVYDLTGFTGTASVGHNARAGGGDVLWFEPAALSACKEAATVLVHWDASSLPGVGKVEVRTIRPNGKEGLFASAGPIGSKQTGPWMSAGRQLILRNGKDGSIIGRATLNGLPCTGAIEP